MMENYLLSKGLYHFIRIFLPGENFHTHILQEHATEMIKLLTKIKQG